MKVRDLPFIDAHVHLWDLSRHRLCLADAALRRQTGRTAVRGRSPATTCSTIICAEARTGMSSAWSISMPAPTHPLAETDWLQGLGGCARHAQRHRRLRGARRSGRGGAAGRRMPRARVVRGIRHIVNLHADPNRTYTARDVTRRRSAGRSGFALLGEMTACPSTSRPIPASLPASPG